MPGLFHQPTERRNFLKVLSAAGAATVFAGCSSAPRTASADPGGKPLHFALLSDTHVAGDKADTNRGFKPWDNLKRVVGEVEEVRPEGVILCGDAARLEGKPEDYREVKALLTPLSSFAPIFIALGNHDDRANFNQAFAQPSPQKAGIKDKHVLAIEEQDMRFVILDSLLFPNKTPGLLGKEQRAWLKDYVATKSDKPLIIFVHHTLTDNDGDLLDAHHLFESVAPHKHVKAIFFGHSHVWEIKQRDHLQLINLPAIGYTFRDQEPIGWVDARFDRNGVDLTLRAIGGNTSQDRKITRVDWIA
jgi:3',5'-cyclic-AMP phosphodiesterase